MYVWVDRWVDGGWIDGWTDGGTDLTADLAQVARPTKTPTVSQWLSPLPGEKRELPSCPEASLQQQRPQRLVGSSEQLKPFLKLLAQPLRRSAKHFLPRFFNPGEMLSECFQFVYAQLIKIPFCKSCLNSERPGKHPPVLFICERDMKGSQVFC